MKYVDKHLIVYGVLKTSVSSQESLDKEHILQEVMKKITKIA